jgi:iron(III) transport system permease protein
MPSDTAAVTAQLAPSAGKVSWGWVNPWTIGTAVIAGLAILPIAAIVWIALAPGDGIWAHLVSTVLPSYIFNTLVLMLGVGAGTILIGVASAWLVSTCRFPMQNIFEWAMLLPLAMPAYVIAYIYTGIFEFAGPVQEMLRDWFGWTSKRDYWFPEIRSLGGAISMMTLVLYPYVYLLSRAAFMEQSVGVLEASRVLGRGPWRSFFSVAFPLARPAVVIGVSLVMMETLNDFGTVDFFGVSTFTLGIYDVWLNMNNVTGAAQLALTLLIFVMILVLAERFARAKKRYYVSSAKYQPLPRYQLHGARMWLSVAVCATPVLLGFVLPVAVLGVYASAHLDQFTSTDMLRFAGNSILLSTLAAALAVVIGTFMAYGLRLRSEKLLKIIVRIASLGYAVPGSVLAVGELVTLGAIDNSIDGSMRRTFGISTGLLLSGTIVAVTYGYLVRFLALSFGGVEASLAKITPNMDGAAKSLGHGPLSTLRRVHIPMMKGGLLTAAILVFVDAMKELPLTVILRPFDFHTMATIVHEFASDEQIGEAAPAALAIVAFGILPVILLSMAIRRSRPGHSQG